MFIFYQEKRLESGGEYSVKLIPFIAFLYSSIEGVLPRTEERTTTGVEANKDSPFYF